MRLHYREYGSRSGTAPAVLLLHGLFGSAANWHGIARQLQKRFHVLSPDLRNHGRSPHHGVMDYGAMADDVSALVDALGLDRVWLVGHSMGGKAAMWLALQHPERVLGLVAVDIAPVRYTHEFDGILSAMESVPLGSLENRAAADAALARNLESPSLRGYLLQNLVRDRDRWRWRVNLPALRGCMEHIVGFPLAAEGRQFPGETLFIYGGRSDYVNPDNAAIAQRLFPLARLRMIPQAGHWVYSDAPEPFLAALRQFLPA